MAMASNHLKLAYEKSQRGEPMEDTDFRINLEALRDDQDLVITAEKRVNPDVGHPFSRLQLISEAGAMTPRLDNWYRTALAIWDSSFPLVSAPGMLIHARFGTAQAGSSLLERFLGSRPHIQGRKSAATL